MGGGMCPPRTVPYHLLVDERRRARARRDAVVEVDAGASKASVARRHRVSRQTIDTWCNLADPVTREVALEPDGPKRKVPLQVLAEKVAPLLDAGPRACGYDADAWTASLACKLVEREVGVSYSAGYIGRLLHQLGYSPQKPERRARERDEERIERWRLEVLPEVEKKAG